MCITIPAKIIQKEKDWAMVKSRGRQIKVKLAASPKVKKGDWVLTYGNLALKKISKKEAEEIIKTLNK